MALLRADDGSTLEVPVPERLRDKIDVGASVKLSGDDVVDWGSRSALRLAR
jgi:hypothetical protein